MSESTQQNAKRETPVPCAGCGRVPQLRRGEYLYASMSHRRDCPLRVGRPGYARAIQPKHDSKSQLKRRLADLETELQQLRLAADGKESQLLNITANARRLYHHYCQSNADTSRITTDLSGIIRSLEGLAAAYRAAGEGK